GLLYVHVSVVLRSLFVFTVLYFFFQAEDGIRDFHVTGVQTCALPILVGGKYAINDRWDLNFNFGQFKAKLETTLTTYDTDFRARSEERRVGKECRSRWAR